MHRELLDLDWPWTTGRLRLRPVRTEDLPAVHAYRERPDVARWLGGGAGTPQQFAAWFGRPERMARTLVAEHDGAVVGDLMVSVRDAWAQTDVAERARGSEAELGWVLDPAYGGRGLATEAVRALVAICFSGLGLRRVVALCFADNTASWRLMERVGMRREQHAVRDSLHRDLGWLDGYGYALLAEEWRATHHS